MVIFGKEKLINEIFYLYVFSKANLCKNGVFFNMNEAYWYTNIRVFSPVTIAIQVAMNVKEGSIITVQHASHLITTMRLASQRCEK